MFPVGIYFCFKKLSDANIFAILYGITSIYFAGVMVRLMLVLAPIACVLSAIAVSETLKTYMKYLKPRPTERAGASQLKGQSEIGYIMVGGISLLLVLYVFHCTWVTSEAYSSPSIVLAARGGDGG
jgi:dolichyl-diphosphooligosaccharide--protein glycosyltransferase